jgi:hypothetical protein
MAEQLFEAVQASNYAPQKIAIMSKATWRQEWATTSLVMLRTTANTFQDILDLGHLARSQRHNAIKVALSEGESLVLDPVHEMAKLILRQQYPLIKEGVKEQVKKTVTE